MLEELALDKVETEDIQNLIYDIRDFKVMLDSDIAHLYAYETKQLNRVVQRNIRRFPATFCFRLTDIEYKNLRCQNGTSNENEYGGRRYNPYVFTEHGIIMLAGLLRSETAINMSINIVKTFVEMRKIIANTNIIKKLNDYDIKFLEYDKNFKKMFDAMKTGVISKEKIFFQGQIYDAYSVMIDIFNSSKEEIIIIDNYLDKNLLDILAKTEKRVTVIANKYNNNDLEKYKSQYNNLNLIINNSFHDRFIIIDKKILYYSGASFKDLGKKCFGLNKIEDKEYLDKILNFL